MTAGFVLVEPGIALGEALFQIFFMITIPASIAQCIGNYFIYAIAYRGGKPVIKKFRKFIGFSWSDIKKVKKRFKKREGLSLVLMRALPIIPLSIISAGAGVLKIDWKRFGIYSFIGLIPRNFFLAFVGWKLSEVYLTIAHQIDSLETLVTITIICVIVLFIVIRKFRVIEKIEERVLK